MLCVCVEQYYPVMLSRTDRNKLSSEGKILYNLLEEHLTSFKNELSGLVKVNSEISELLKQKDAELADVKEKNAEMSKEILSLKDALDHAYSYERKDSVILPGPALKAPTDNQNTYDVVKNLLHDHLNIDIQTRDINITHRLGPIKPGSNLKNIYVKFVRRADKQMVIAASKTVNRAAAGGNAPRSGRLYANESLTPTRRKIFAALRRMKVDAPTMVKGCTTDHT